MMITQSIYGGEDGGYGGEDGGYGWEDGGYGWEDGGYGKEVGGYRAVERKGFDVVIMVDSSFKAEEG
ncbi:hypothetical protein Tco_1527137 [Tanacetum coccineum]